MNLLILSTRQNKHCINNWDPHNPRRKIHRPYCLLTDTSHAKSHIWNCGYVVTREVMCEIFIRLYKRSNFYVHIFFFFHWRERNISRLYILFFSRLKTLIGIDFRYMFWYIDLVCAPYWNLLNRESYMSFELKIWDKWCIARYKTRYL